MKITVCSAMTKIFSETDCVAISSGKCLQNESFSFQVYLQAKEDFCGKIDVQSGVNAKVYQVKKVKGDYYIDKEVDDYYVYADEHMYPDLLQEVTSLCLQDGDTATLYVEIPADKKAVGLQEIILTIGKERIVFPLTVLEGELVATDLMIMHWLHIDGICNYYHLQPFSDEFYTRFRQVVASYMKLGNTQVYVPMFTPPLDTAVGGERLTTQLVKVKKDGDRYEFDLSAMEKYMRICMEYGATGFEFSHLFTQWGGEFCPKIIAEVDGKEQRIFGWDTPSLGEEYKNFLKQYLEVFVPFVEKMGVKESSVMHLTDEPHAEHIETYVQLAEFVKQHNGGMKIADALSNYSFASRGAVDMPVVCTGSWEFDKFQDMDRMLYYCVGVDGNYLSNRYFHLPLQRTQVLGYQLYQTGAKGFLHWGYNFYNTRYSLREVNPYEETTAGGEFCAGDSFLVYPGEKDVEYSLRYFAMLKAFEEYRLLKTVEGKIGKQKVMELLKTEGVEGVHIYPHSVTWHESFHEKLYSLL